jgi:hypothetical protein
MERTLGSVTDDRRPLRVDEREDEDGTTLAWQTADGTVSVTLPGRVHAASAQRRALVVTASVDGTVRLFARDGTEQVAFEYATPADADLYTLVPSVVGDLGVTMVFAHDPPHRGETLWQHVIDVDARAVGEPVAKWR